MHAPSLVLASGSPRRAAALDRLGYTFLTMAPEIVEERRPGESAAAMVERLAREKALACSDGHRVVLGVDTTVVLDGEPVGKPRDGDEAVATLLSLSGREHEVISGWAIVRGDGVESGTVTSRVRMCTLSRDEAVAYVATGEPMDKAGAYAIQGEGRRHVEGLEGSFSNVMGFPAEVLVPALARAGITP